MTDSIVAHTPYSGVAQMPQPVTNPPDAVIVCCRECSQPMEAKPWRELRDSAVTCRNPLCGLRSQTFSASSYAHIDLSKYKRKKTR
jgi:hypothetical protein